MADPRGVVRLPNSANVLKVSSDRYSSLSRETGLFLETPFGLLFILGICVVPVAANCVVVVAGANVEIASVVSVLGEF